MRIAKKGIEQEKTGVKGGNWILLAVMLLLPGWAVVRLAAVVDPRLIWGWAGVGVVVGGIACAWDKRKARRGTWRTPEVTLHLIELFGGWPGSFFAQRVFRHKISKRSYQVVFWLIVLLHQVLAALFLFGRP